MEVIAEKVHDSGRCCIAVHSNDYFYTAGPEGVIKRYSHSLSGSTWQLTNTLDEPNQYHDDPINEICFSASGDYFAVCSDDGEVTLLRHPTNSVQSILCKFDCGVSSISFDRSSQYTFLLAMSSDTGILKIVNALNYGEKYYEFSVDPDGIRQIKFIKYCPDPFKMSREKYIAIAQNNATFSIYKVLVSNVFNDDKPAEDKVVKAHEFQGVFPKIKGGDTNQRLLFDSTQNGHFIAIPGNTTIKILDTRKMKFVESNELTHNVVTNCCAFNECLENSEQETYVLATGDTAGNVVIWNLKYENDTLKVSVLDKCTNGGGGICELVWKDSKELFCSSMNGAIYRYQYIGGNAKKTGDDSMSVVEAKEMESDCNNGMEVDKSQTEATGAGDQKLKKKRFEEDSDEDFDIDMDDEEEAGDSKKIVLRKKTEPDPSPEPEPKVESATKTESDGTSAVAKGDDQQIHKNQEIQKKQTQQLQDDLAAAEALFADDTEDTFGDINNTNTMKTDDVGIDTTKEDETEDQVMDEDNGADLDGFIVDDEKTKKEKNAVDDGAAMDEVDGDRLSRMDGVNGVNEMDYPPAFPVHDPFVNGCTEYDEDGQRYLLFNEICGVIVRKQDVSSNPMEMNNIMSSLNNRKYVYELDFFDKSRYSRAVHIKSDHHFICCDVNSYGLLLGSEPSMDPMEDADTKESIVRYKPISRNGEYRSFASEKDCEWTTRLPLGEHCVAVGLTSKFAIIATNRRYLRILSVGGLQTNTVLCVPQNVVHIAGTTQNKTSNIVAITFEDLSLWILDLDTNQVLHKGEVAISPQSRLTRMFLMGSASDYKLVSIDSDGIVRLLSTDTFGMQWIVILDIDDHLTKTYPAGFDTAVVAEMRPKGVWPVFFDRTERKLMAMELKFMDHPTPSQSNGSYVLIDYPLSVPLLNMGPEEVDINTGDAIVMFGNREEEMMTAAVCHQFESTKSNESGNGNNGNSNKAKQHKKQMLKDYLMLFGHCCKNAKTVCAYDIAIHFLDTEKALSGAIKVAMHHQLPLLAEQLSVLAKQRLENAQKTKQQQMKQMNHVNGGNGGNGTPSNGNGSKLNPPTSTIKKPSRSLGRLKRPTAKLGVNRKNSNESIGMESMTSSLERTQLIGNKRPNNPCNGGNNGEPPKKRNYVAKSNPFSCSDAQRTTKKSSIFSV